MSYSHTTSTSLAPMGGAIEQWRQAMLASPYCAYCSVPPSRTCQCPQCTWYFKALTDEKDVAP